MCDMAALGRKARERATRRSWWTRSASPSRHHLYKSPYLFSTYARGWGSGPRGDHMSTLPRDYTISDACTWTTTKRRGFDGCRADLVRRTVIDVQPLSELLMVQPEERSQRGPVVVVFGRTSVCPEHQRPQATNLSAPPPSPSPLCRGKHRGWRARAGRDFISSFRGVAVQRVSPFVHRGANGTRRHHRHQCKQRGGGSSGRAP